MIGVEEILMDRGRVAIVLVNYNGAKDTIECIESIKHSVYTNYEIIVVDNCSTDNSVEQLEKYSISADFTLIRAKKNNGFSAGNNIGIREAQKKNFDYVLLLNNDTLVTPIFLQEMLDSYLNIDKESVLTGTILYANECDKVWYAGGLYSRWTSQAKHLRMNQSIDQLPQAIEKINYICGCEMLIPIITLNRVGMLDEDYFLYYEDLDYSMRIDSLGIDMYYVPSSVIFHKVSSSTGGMSSMVSYYYARNAFLTIRKNYSPVKRLLVSIFVFFQLLHRIVHKRLFYKPALYGWVDYHRSVFGKSDRVL